MIQINGRALALTQFPARFQGWIATLDRWGPVMPRASVRSFRAVVTLLVAAAALAAAGCVATEPPSVATPAPAALTAAAESPPSAYISLLRSQGIDTAIPARGKFILVNIPSFELVALQDGVPALRSRVVVGRPVTPTPELLSMMVAVQFNPGWWPTPSMIRNEAAHYIPPGPQNPLGRMMFDLDNDEFIYLHDTNDKALFKRPQPAFSHGCVRVEQARALAAWSLGVSEQEIDALVAQGTHSVPVTENIPVALVYHTRFPDAQGQPAAYPDLYTSRR
jgi:lipoprotein-anchoring transpeptidase ErfK/SrfK